MPTPGHATSPVSPSTCRSSAEYQLNFAPRQEAHNNKGPPSVRGWALVVPTHMTTRLLQKPTWLLPALRTVDFHYDDGHSLVRNPHLRDLGNLPRFFLDPSLSVKTRQTPCIAVVLVAHTINQWHSPDHPAGFLALNLALHGLVTLLLLNIFSSLLQSAGKEGVAPRAAFFCILFAIHSLQTEVVNYVSARSESLAALGILLAVLAFLRYRHSAEPVWLVALAAGQLFALGAKEVAVVTPVLLLSIQRFLPAGTASAARRANLMSALIVVPYLIAYQSFRGSTPSPLLRPVASQIATQKLVLCWQRTTDWKTKISLWEDAIRQAPAMAASHHNLAFAYHQQSRMELANRHYEEAIALEPEYTRPLTNLGILYRDSGQLERAEEVLLRAVRSAPALEPLNNLGLVYAAQHRPEQAVGVYQTALQADPGVAEVWFNLGLALRDAGSDYRHEIRVGRHRRSPR